MAMKPGKIHGLSKTIGRPFATLGLKVTAHANEPKIFNVSKVPYEIPSSALELLKKKGITDISSYIDDISSGSLKTIAETDAARSIIFRSMLNNALVRNGKIYKRNADSILNTIKRLEGQKITKEMLDANKAVGAAVNATNAPYYGRAVSVGDVLMDDIARIGHSVPVLSGATATAAAKASEIAGTKPKLPILVNTGGSQYSLPSSYGTMSGRLVLNTPFLTTPTHEMFHAKDFKNNILPRIASPVGSVVENLALVGSPISILYGDKISNEIPGNVDDALINTLKYVGPELFLAGRLARRSPELYAVKNTKSAIKNNQKYFESAAASLGKPISSENLMKMQDVKGRTYPASALTDYGLLRLGTMPLYMMKQSSTSFVSPTIGAKDYVSAAKGLIKNKINSIRGLAKGITDTEVIKSMLYHDSANKYNRISTLNIPQNIMMLLPAIIVGEHYRNQQTPPIINVLDYKKDIKQGLGA